MNVATWLMFTKRNFESGQMSSFSKQNEEYFAHLTYLSFLRYHFAQWPMYRCRCPRRSWVEARRRAVWFCPRL